MSNSIVSCAKTLRVAGLLVLTCALAGPAPAADAAVSDIVVKHVLVRYGDLDLKTESGARQLVRRLNVAAIEACGGRPKGPLALIADSKRRFEVCRGTAVQTAVTTVDQPMVTTVYLNTRARGPWLAQR
jgi:UrcA family protein